MKKILISILLILNLSSCATAGSEIRFVKKHEGIHPSFQSYVDDFIELSGGRVTKKHLKGFSIGFKKFKDNSTTVGYCHPIAKEIDINLEWWYSPYQHDVRRLELIFHELGHCILKRGHTKKPVKQTFSGFLERVGFYFGMFKEKDDLSDGCPSSIMHPELLDYYCIQRNYKYYMKELFDNAATTSVIYGEYVSKRESEDHPLYVVDNANPTGTRCEKANVINHTDDWNDKDIKTLRRAHKRCLDKYNTCLKTFIKKEHSVYNIVCK